MNQNEGWPQLIVGSVVSGSRRRRRPPRWPRWHEASESSPPDSAESSWSIPRTSTTCRVGRSNWWPAATEKSFRFRHRWGRPGRFFFVEVPREYAASFKLDLEQDALPSTLTTNATGCRGRGRHHECPAVVGDLHRASRGCPDRWFLKENGRWRRTPSSAVPLNSRWPTTPGAQAAATTVLEILVVAPPSLAPTNSVPVPATPAN